MRRLLLLLLAVGCAARPHLQVAAAASLQDALQAAGANYEKARGEHVDFAFAGSNVLAMQIRAGAPIDVFISADEKTMDAVASQIVPGTRRDLLSNELVVVSLQPLHGMADLLKVPRIALGDPSAVPAGVYTREYFQRIGVWAAIEPHVIPTANVRAALAAADGGNADAAVVYRTDALLARRAHIAFAITGPEAPVVRYPAAVLRQSRDPAAARRFLDDLASPAGAAVFRKYGFAAAPSSG
ncbi:MAG TPA: molybdate ABC transporter substrate-binding protein [Thermoanaerobaculia bacterium]|nr:molybdate ABC transporter substrate-binding protein [Thermoanaerobaculia bacterium]